MVHTIHFSDLVWNQQAILLPEVNRTYLLTQVKLEQAEAEPEESNDIKKYALFVNRSMELICHIVVNPSDAANLKTLQNFLLKSSIRRFGQ